MSQVIVERSGAVLTIQINRIEAKNALSLDMYQVMTKSLFEFNNDETLRVAVIKGHKDSFTAGNDLKDFLGGGELNRQHPTVQFLHQINETNKPIVAAINGPAIGIGTTMLLHCDYVVAGSETVFQLPFAKLGVCPELASSLLLPRLVGYHKAFEWLVLGERFTAEEAKRAGLVNDLVSPEDVFYQANAIAEKIAALPKEAVDSAKRLLKENVTTLATQTIEKELTEFQRLLNSEQTKSIIASFFKK
jgi:enoyl-CoA hydratase/carnithine racemase